MSENTKLPMGLILSGICMGSETTQDGAFTNNNIYIKVGERDNEVGEKVSIIETVSVFGDNLQQMMSNAQALKGKHVTISINRSPARKELRNAFMRNSINRQSTLTMVG